LFPLSFGSSSEANHHRLRNALGICDGLGIALMNICDFPEVRDIKRNKK
jgi:hypothetical protein